MSRFREKFIGTRQFYTSVLTIALPIIVQNGITNFVNLLDNIMVGRVGTEPMSGVAIVNQLIFIYNLCIFGGLSGAGIFTAQYNGQQDMEGIRNTMRFKLILGTVLTVLAFIILEAFGPQLIGAFLQGSSDGGDLEATLNYGLDYLHVVIWGLIPFMLLQVYSSTLRECGETVLPMKASFVAVAVNMVFNYLLIFGKLGFPRLGTVGAAIATVMSRFTEAFIVMTVSHKNSEKYVFLKGTYTTLKVPKDITKKIIVMGMPLLLNELCWSSGQTMLNQSYSLRGLNAVAGFNITSTMSNLYNVILYSMGSTVGIMVGKLLGAGNTEEAVDTDRKLIVFSMFMTALSLVFLIPIGRIFPEVYNTSQEAKALARTTITIYAFFMPLQAFKNATYYTLRSGGRTFITFFFDGGMVWLISVPIAFFFSRFTDFSAVFIFTAVYVGELIKCLVGLILVKKRVWIRNIVCDIQ